MRNILSTILLTLLPLALCGQPQVDTLKVSVMEVVALVRSNNNTVKIAHEGVVRAEAQRLQLRSGWYPTLSITGDYLHTTSPIGVGSTLGAMAGEGVAALESLLGSDPVAVTVLKNVASTEFDISLVPRNTLALGVNFSWPIIAGGKRIAASKIGNQLQEIAQEGHRATVQNVSSRVICQYLALSLANEILQSRQLAYKATEKHLFQAQRLHQEGFITRSELLVAEVGLQQASAEVVAAQNSLRAAQCAIAESVGIDTLTIIPTTPLMMIDSLPPKEFFASHIEANNPTLKMATAESHIARQQLHISRGNYLPEVALLAHQRLYSRGLDNNLFPKSFVGIGLSWTLFDGFKREMSLRTAQSALRTASLAHQSAHTTLSVALEQLYGQLLALFSQATTLQSAERAARELYFARQRAFSEGMATSAEVSDAIVAVADTHISTLTVAYTSGCALAALLEMAGITDEFYGYYSNDFNLSSDDDKAE